MYFKLFILGALLITVSSKGFQSTNDESNSIRDGSPDLRINTFTNVYKEPIVKLKLSKYKFFTTILFEGKCDIVNKIKRKDRLPAITYDCDIDYALGFNQGHNDINRNMTLSLYLKSNLPKN